TVEPERDVQQCLAAAIDGKASAAGLVDAVQHAQQGRLAGAVAAEDRQPVALPQLEADVVEETQQPALRRIECGAEEQSSPAGRGPLALQVRGDIQCEVLDPYARAHVQIQSGT